MRNNAKAIISAIYLITVVICTICLQTSAIMIIFKLCNTTTLSWLNCCVPIIITIILAPILFITKSLIDK